MWKKRKFKDKSPKGFKFWFVIPMVLIILGVFFVIKFEVFTIKKIKILTEGSLCVDESQLKSASGLLNQNLLLINSAKKERDLMQKFYCLKFLKLSKYLPDKITIQTANRKPFILLANLKAKIATPSFLITDLATPSAEQIGDVYFLDNEGVAYTRATAELTIPKIYNQDLNISLGQKLEEKINNNLFKILEKLKTLGLQFEVSWITDGFLIINPPPIKIIFDLKNNIDIQLASLQLILDKAKIYSESLEFIDLRFDKPVVRYAPKK